MAARAAPAAEKAPQWTAELRGDGWGYSDTEFQLNGEGQIQLAGSRYPFSGFVFPNFRPWVETVVGINIQDEAVRPPQRRPAPPVAAIAAAWLPLAPSSAEAKIFAIITEKMCPGELPASRSPSGRLVQLGLGRMPPRKSGAPSLPPAPPL